MVRRAKLIFGDSRSMGEIADSSVELIVTSPPYWHIKDYSVEGQIGFGQSLHEYLKALYQVWNESFRVLRPGRRLCINIGDQFARASIYGRYKIIPLHAEVISQCEALGFDFMGSIIWQKKTTMKTTGGATVMGSYPYPPNGLAELDYEHILLFKSPGKEPKGTGRISPDIKQRSRISKEDWKQHFSGHWYFGGAKKHGHEAMFPEELPRRLIRMFTFVDETVLDPFLGSGTTIKAALDLERKAIGYEINETFIELIKEKLGPWSKEVLMERRKDRRPALSRIKYTPRIQDAHAGIDTYKDKVASVETFKVVEVIDELTLLLDNGRRIRLLGLNVPSSSKGKAKKYLNERIRGRAVLLKFDARSDPSAEALAAYVYLQNKIFVNAYMVRSGLATVDKDADFTLKAKFLKLGK